MSSKRSVLRFVAAAAAILTIPPVAAAQTAAAAKVESFSGTTVNLNPGAGENLQINVLKWTTDTERDALLAAVKEKGATSLGAALEKAPTAGYIWDSGPIGYPVRYAQKIPSSDGSERIVLVTDRPLGSWTRNAWRVSAKATPPDYSFTLVELRLDKNGHGEGKMSLAGPVTVDLDSRAPVLEDYARAPVLIDKVRRLSSNAQSK